MNEYIRDLLLFNEQVIFPGFGTLEIKKEPAKLSGTKMSPPASVLRFNPELKRDDGLLSAKVSQAEELDETEAREQVLEYIDSIIFTFNKGEQFEIGGVCTLFQDEDNNIIVTRDPELNLEHDSFGLETLELDSEADMEVMSSPEEEPVEKTTEPATEPIPEVVKPPVTETTSTEAPVFEEKTMDEPETKTIITDDAGIPPADHEYGGYVFDGGGKRNKNTVWILSGAIVVVLTALVIMTLKTDMLDGTFDIGSIFKSSDTIMQVDDDFSTISEGDSEFDNMVSELDSELDTATTMQHAMAPLETAGKTENVKPPALSGEYHIIAGSFKDKENAVQLQKDLTMEGFQCNIIERGDGYYRVSAISFRDKQTALRKLDDFRKIKGMNKAWVMALR